MNRPRLPASGWLDPEPFNDQQRHVDRRPKVRDAVARHAPSVPFEEIERSAAWYLLALQSAQSSTAPSELRSMSAGLRRDAVALHDALCNLVRRSSGYPLAGDTEHIVAIGELAVSLQRFEISLPKGRPVAPDTILVREMAAILMRAGYPTSTKANGPLVLCVGAVLEGLGKKPKDIGGLGDRKDVRKLVVDAMRGRRTKPPAGVKDLSGKT